MESSPAISSKPKDSHWKARKRERVTEGSTQNEMRMEASRPRSIAALRLLLRTAACARSAEATAIISTSGHSPLKARRVVRPPTHVHEGKMKLPTSKLSTSSQDSQSLSSLGREKPASGVAGLAAGRSRELGAFATHHRQTRGPPRSGRLSRYGARMRELRRR